MLFIGIDLAWSEKNGTGIAIVKGDRRKAELVAAKIVFSDKEIIDFIEKERKNQEAFIAIDAPLIVPNNSGRRIAEELVGMLFRKYNAGAHPANRQRLAQWSGKIRGEEISKLLIKNGFKHSPFVKKFEKAKKFFEVYPHPSMVVLFNLDKILQYKLKPNRDYDFRWQEFRKYQDYLSNLKNSKTRLILPEDILYKDIKNLKGNALKDYEDILDAIFCSYLAYYHWSNPEKCEVLGDMEGGYILTPIFDFMKKQLKEYKSQKNLIDF